MARNRLFACLLAAAFVIGLAAHSSADVCNGGCGGGGSQFPGSGGGGLPASGGPTLNISDAVSVGRGASSSGVREGQTCQFTVKLKDGHKIASAHWKTKDNTAKAPGDYVPGEGDIQIDPHEDTNNRAFIFVDTNFDQQVEDNENFFVVLSNAHNAEIGDGKGKCVIIDLTKE